MNSPASQAPPPYASDDDLALKWAEEWLEQKTGNHFGHYANRHNHRFVFENGALYVRGIGPTRALAIVRAAARLPEIREILESMKEQQK